ERADGGDDAAALAGIDDRDVGGGELREHLAAASARSGRPAIATGDGDGVDAPATGGDCHGHGIALGADRERIGAVLHVGGGEDLSAGEDGGTDLEAGVWRVRVGAGAGGGFEQCGHGGRRAGG